MSSTTTVHVGLVSDEEISECSYLLSKSFGHDAPFVDIYFPNHDTPPGQASLSKRLTTWKQFSPNSTFLKAVIQFIHGQKDQEQIVGFGIWTLMKEAPPAELGQVENVIEVWPDKNDREFMTRLWSSYVIPRSQVVNASTNGVYGKLPQIRRSVCTLPTCRFSS